MSTPNDFIAIDFETADYSADSAISIGLVKYRNYKPIASYYSLISPPILYIRPEFTDIHGLTVDDVRDAPDFKYVWENGLCALLNPSGTSAVPVVAHNAGFDMNVLRAALEYYSVPCPPMSYFCTLRLSRRIWPRLKSHSLPNLAKEFSINYDAHNAAADADTCARIVVLAAEAVSSRLKRKTMVAPDRLLKAAHMEMETLGVQT